MSKQKFAALILAALMAVLPICGTLSASAAPVEAPSEVQTSGDGGSTQDPQADTIPTEAEPHASLPAETENTEPVETEPTIPSETEGSEPTKTENTEPSEEVSAPAEGKSISLPGGVTIAKVTTCSNVKENGNTVDQNTDTVWTSKDSHEPDNIHYWECSFDQLYAVSGAAFTLGRRNAATNSWGYFPENLKVEVLSGGKVIHTEDVTSVSEITDVTFPVGTTADGLRLSCLDTKKPKGFSIREVDITIAPETPPEEDDGKTPYTEKKVYADYHGPRYTREHDGNTGNWSFIGNAKNTATVNKSVVYNADLILEDGNRDLAAAAYPLIGMQSQMDPDYQEYQILLAKMANIDGFFIEWGFPGHGTDSQLDTMMDIAAKYDFEVGINWCDAWHMKDWITKIKPDVITREDKVNEAVNSLGTILDKLYASPVGATFDGHPIVYLFGGGFEKNEWQKISSEASIPDVFAEKTPWYFRRASMSGKVNAEGKVDFSYAGKSWHEVLDGPFGWVPDRVRNAQQDGLTDFDVYGTTEDAISYLEALKQTFIHNPDIPLRNSVVSPGMDNRPCAGWGDKYKYLDRDNGALYQKVWQYNVDNKEYFDTVYIASWNDYTEGHQIEPTIEDGYRELKTTQQYAYQFKGEGNLDDSGFELPAKLFRLRKRAEKLSAVGVDMTANQSSLDEAGLLISKGSYPQASDLLNQVSDTLTKAEQNVKTEHIVCNEVQKDFVLKQEDRINAAYHAAVSSNQSGEVENAVDGVSKTFWQYTGSDAYLEIDLGSVKNIVCGTILADSPFEIFYEQDGAFHPAEAGLGEDFAAGTGGSFSLKDSATTGKIRIVFANAQGKVYEVKLYQNRLPILNVLAPQNAKQVDFSNPWDISLETQDEDGTISHVEVYIDGMRTEPGETVQEGNTYTLHMQPIPAVRHKIQVRVIDNEGGITASKEMTVSPLLENVALRKPVKANAQMNGFGPELAVDGIISLESRWRTPSSKTEHWIEINLQDMYDICQIDLYMGDNTGWAVRDFQMEYWANGQWNLIPGTKFQGNNIKDLSLMFDPIRTDKVRFYSTEAEGRGIRMKEIEVYAPKAASDVPAVYSSNEGSSESIYALKNGTYLTLSDSVLEKLRGTSYEGYITFSYLDEGQGAVSISAASHDKAPFGDFTTVASIQKAGTDQWRQAKVRFTNDHIVLDHEAENDSDLVFTGDAQIKDISLEFFTSKDAASDGPGGGETLPPDEGNKPTQPEEDTKPTRPEEDTKPTQPEEGNEPTQPEEGTKPTRPVEGTKPTQLEESTRPTQPDSGETPNTGDAQGSKAMLFAGIMVLCAGVLMLIQIYFRKEGCR